MQERIYLDYNATCPIKETVLRDISIFSMKPLNPSSIHSYGRDSRRILEDARKAISEKLNFSLKEYRIIFTSSGTEANNLFIKGINSGNCKYFSTEIEHVSLLKPIESMGEKNFTYIKVDEEGRVNISDLRAKLSQVTEGSKRIVSIIMANNETGVIQDLGEIAKVVHEYGAILHSDAVQALGKVPVNIAEIGCDAITISGHKLGALVGVGVLIVRKSLELNPMILGGGQESGTRSGTENVIAINSLATVIRDLPQELSLYENVRSLRDYLEDRIMKISDRVRIFSLNGVRLPNTSAIMMPYVGAETQVIYFDIKGVAVSAGSACSSGKVKASNTLLALGASKREADSTIRVSLGSGTTLSEVERFVDLWEELYTNNKDKA